MNYLELIKNFWKKDLEVGFSEKEIAFYFYLLKTSNSLGWRNPFGLSNAISIAKFGWGRHSFNNVKNKLKQTGLIDFEARKGRGNIYQYEILNQNKKDAPNTMTKDKIKKSKELILPFSSERFAEMWNKLIQTPKWIEKPPSTLQIVFNRLKEYDEAFAIELIEQSIIGGWQGIIYTDTNIRYEKWKKVQNNNNEPKTNTNESRKAEIVRRATIAAAACSS